MKKNYDRSIIWIRRDLRLHDHRVAEAALAQSESAFFVFVFDTTILNLLDRSDRRVSFIYDSLLDLRSKLRSLYGSDLVLLHGDPEECIPRLARELKVAAVFAAKDTDPAAKLRDASVERALQKENRIFVGVADTLLFEPSEIRNQSAEPYRVFTPFSRACLKHLTPKHIQEAKPQYSRLLPENLLHSHSIGWDLTSIGFEHNRSLWVKGGETAAQEQLQAFASQIDSYEVQRNLPSKPHGTSLLSPHLRFGTVSIRACARFALSKKNKGHEVWMSELLWREFFHHILDHYPGVVDRCFRAEYDAIQWENRPQYFEAWKEGRTGYPIVDAAMVHFKQTGWMHNRLRMIVASFLTKDLLIDWRWGERYFAALLLDYDLAQNNGNWQWAASTGCDAQPYFRIFNPTSQSEKFDPEGDFIRSVFPERKNLSKKEIHAPVRPIVDHSSQREKALALYKAVR